MARYWVGGTGNWDASTTTNWSDTSGGAGGFSVPTSTDDVIFDTLSNATAYTVTITATANCANLTIGNPLAGSLTLAGSQALDVYGNFNIANITRTYTGAITFRATTTGKTLTFNGETVASATVFDGVGGGWTVQDAWNNGTSNITLTNGALDTNGQTITCGAFNSNTANTRSLTLGASVLNVTSWNISTATGITFSAGTSSIVHTPGSATFAGGGLTYYDVSLNLLSTLSTSFSGINTFNNLTITQTTIGSSCSVQANQTINGVLTLTGNSATNRCYIRSGTPGTQFTLTAATVTATRVDMQDIVGAGAASWNLSAITGLSGDCGGNSGITFTTPATQTANGTTSFSWSTAARWTSRVPLPQDDVVINNAFSASQTVTADMPRLGKSIDWTGATGTPTFTTSTTASIFGSLTLISGMTLTASTQAYTFEGRSTYTLTNAGKSWAKNITLNAPGGTLTLQDAFTLGTANTFTLTNGTFDANGQDVSVGLFASGTNTTRVLTMGSGAWTLTGNAATIWSIGNVTGLTLNRGAQGVVCNYSGATGTRSITAGGTYPEASVPSFYITAGTDAVATQASFLDLDLTGFAGTFNNSARTIYGNLMISTGATVAAGGNATTFAATSGTNTITSNGKTLDFPITFNGVGGTWQPVGTLTVGSTRTMTLTSGTFDANNQNISTGLFNASAATTRTLTMGSGTWTLTGTGTIWSTNVATGLTLNANTSTVDANNSSATARTIIGNSAARLATFKVSAGTGTVTPNSLFATDLDFTGFAGTFGVGVVDLTGNLTLASGMTVSDGANVVTFSSTSGTKTITTNGVSFSRPMTFDGVGGTWNFQDTFTGGAARRVTVTNGTLNFNNQNITVGLITVGTGATLTMGSGTLELTGTGSTTANINASATINCDTSTIKVTDPSASAVTLALGGMTYNNLWFARGASVGSHTITGNNIFNDLKDDGSVAHSLIFSNSTTTQVETFTVSGNAGQLVTITSSGTAIHTLTAPSRSNASPISCDYLDISHSVTVQANTWYAGNNSVDNQAVTTAGSGWIFTAPVVVGGNNSNFFMFM